MKTTLIKKQYKYLGEVPEFKENGLPSGYLIDKGKVGCGGTSLALEDNRDTIVCVPFVSLVKNKMQKYPDKVLGVYEGVTKQAIQNYIDSTTGAKKIICTYDSLAKVAEITGYDYFLLIDELHLLFIQYVFRDKAIKSVLNLYKNFKYWSFLTATPIEYDLMLEELKDIPTYKIDWEDKTEIGVTTVKCKQVGATVKKLINDYLEGRMFGNAHIFVNSVDFIANMIKNCNLTNENTRIIFSKNNKNYQNKCQGIRNCETTDEVKKINLYTSTCFEGCDLFDKEGKIYIVSDSSKAQTLADISTSIRQIAGRIRNTIYPDITHIYKATRYNEDLSFEDYKKVVLDEEAKAKSYIAKINQDRELVEGTKESEFVYVYKDEDNVFKFDLNLMKLDIYNYKCLHHTYSLQANLTNEYENVGFKVIQSSDNTSDKLLKNENVRITFKDAYLEYDTIRKRDKTFNFSLNDDDRKALLKKKYPFIEDAYQILGLEGVTNLKFHTANIKRYLISHSDKLNNIAKIANLLKTVEGFKEGAFVTGKQIKEVLGTIYSSIGITSKPSIEDFRQYTTIESKVKKIDGKSTKGYIIQYIKIK